MRRICGTINFGVSIWLIAVVVLTIVTVKPCFSECEFDWKPGNGLSSIDNNSVFTMTRWDPDGNGPQPELLIAGGYFTTAGGVSVNRIAAWDGNSWQSLGSGMNKTVYALTVYNGKLIAGGWFDTAGGTSANFIAAWDGNSWQPLGTGLNNTVWALTVYNDELVAAGTFDQTGDGADVFFIARWDGNSWRHRRRNMGGFSVRLRPYSL